MSEAPVSTATSFDLDDDLLAFREVCRNFVVRELAPLVRDAEQAGTFPPELWPKMADAGLLGLGHPEEYGGSGGGVLATAILSEELARASGGLAVTPLVSSYMAAPAPRPLWQPTSRRSAGCGRCWRARRSPRSPSPSPARAPTSPASRPGRSAVEGGHLLSGTKMFITNAGLADFIDRRRQDRPRGRPPRDHDLPGRARRGGDERSAPPLEKLGWHSSDTREIVFDDCFVGRRPRARRARARLPPDHGGLPGRADLAGGDGGRPRPGGARRSGRPRARAPHLRHHPRRPPDDPPPPRDRGGRARIGADADLPGGGALGLRPPRGGEHDRDGEARRRPRSPRGSSTRRCRSSAATASSRRRRWRCTTATPASCASAAAPTRSSWRSSPSGWGSMAGERSSGPARRPAPGGAPARGARRRHRGLLRARLPRGLDDRHRRASSAWARPRSTTTSPARRRF